MLDWVKTQLLDEFVGLLQQEGARFRCWPRSPAPFRLALVCPDGYARVSSVVYPRSPKQNIGENLRQAATPPRWKMGVMLTTVAVERLTQNYLCHRLRGSESPLGLDFFSSPLVWTPWSGGHSLSFDTTVVFTAVSGLRTSDKVTDTVILPG